MLLLWRQALLTTLLNDAEDGVFQHGGQLELRHVGAELDLNLVPILAFLDKALNGSKDSALHKLRRAQTSDEPSRLGMAVTNQLNSEGQSLGGFFGILFVHGLVRLELHDRTSQLLGQSVMDLAAYQVPFVIAGFQQVPQNLQGLLLLRDVTGHMNAADNLPRLVPQGARGDEEIAAEAIIVHFGGVLLAIGQSKGMGARRWRLACPVNAFVALQSDALLGRAAQLFRHRLIDPHDSVMAIEDGDQVGDAVESAFPQAAIHLERGLALVFLRTLHHGHRGLTPGTHTSLLIATATT